MDENELLELSGTVDSVIYKNEENGYTVLRLRDENGEGVTIMDSPGAAYGKQPTTVTPSPFSSLRRSTV